MLGNVAWKPTIVWGCSSRCLSHVTWLSLLGFEQPRLHHLHPKVGTLMGATIIMYELYARFRQRLEVTFISKSRSSSKKNNVISPAGRRVEPKKHGNFSPARKLRLDQQHLRLNSFLTLTSGGRLTFRNPSRGHKRDRSVRQLSVRDGCICHILSRDQTESVTH